MAHRIRAHFEDRPRGVSAHSCIPFVPSIASPSDSPLKILHMGSTVVVRSARRACIPSGEHGHELMSHSRVRFRVEDRCSLTPACSRLRARSALSGGARPAPAARCKMSEAVAIHPPRGRTSEHGASQPATVLPLTPCWPAGVTFPGPPDRHPDVTAAAARWAA